MLFFDSSALVKRYVLEEHSTRVRRLAARHPVAISRWTEVEVSSAFARLAREGRLSGRARGMASARFRADLDAWHIVEITPVVTRLATDLLARHDLRAGDAIQLASAVWLRQSVDLAGLQAFDARLVAALEAEHFVMPIPLGRA